MFLNLLILFLITENKTYIYLIIKASLMMMLHPHNKLIVIIIHVSLNITNYLSVLRQLFVEVSIRKPKIIQNFLIFKQY